MYNAEKSLCSITSLLKMCFMYLHSTIQEEYKTWILQAFHLLAYWNTTLPSPNYHDFATFHHGAVDGDCPPSRLIIQHWEIYRMTPPPSYLISSPFLNSSTHFSTGDHRWFRPILSELITALRNISKLWFWIAIIEWQYTEQCSVFSEHCHAGEKGGFSLPGFFFKKILFEEKKRTVQVRAWVQYDIMWKWGGEKLGG